MVQWRGALTLLMYMMVFILNFPLSSTARSSIRNTYCLLSIAGFDCVWPWKATLTYIRKEDEEEMNGLFSLACEVSCEQHVSIPLPLCLSNWNFFFSSFLTSTFGEYPKRAKEF